MNRLVSAFIFVTGFVTANTLLGGLAANVEGWIGNLGKGGSA